MIFNPNEYVNYKNAKQMYTDKQLLKILEDARPDNNK